MEPFGAPTNFKEKNLKKSSTKIDWPGQLSWKLTYLMMILEASVLPDPDSPEITIHVSFPDLFILVYAISCISLLFWVSGLSISNLYPARGVFRAMHNSDLLLIINRCIPS